MNKVEVLKSFEDLSVLFGLRVETPEVEHEIGLYAYKVVGFTAKYDGVIHKGCTDEEAQEIASSLGYRVVLVDVRNKTDEAKNKKLFINGAEMKGLLNCITLGEEKEKADMECYIRDYKHLIGCEYSVDSVSRYIDSNHINTHWIDTKPNLGWDRLFFYLDNGTKVSYREYMEAYYPEYKHIWQEQL